MTVTLRNTLILAGVIAVMPTAAGSEPIIAEDNESILAEIQRTGVLKVAIRQDAAPFGYLTQIGQLDGYCHDMAQSLQRYISYTLQQRTDVQLVEIPSTLENRFSLVQDRLVHLECGPNTIRSDIEGVSFSESTYVSSAYFLTQQELPIDSTSSLEDVRVGVLRNTTTEQFLKNHYPEAHLVYFQGASGRADGIYAVTAGHIDAFISDGVLTLSEMVNQHLSVQEYALIPDQPLTCEFYGLALPDDDSDWQTMINDFLTSNAEDTVWTQWFGEAVPYVVDLFNQCSAR